MKVVPVILCGGAGTRLWPLSREHMPKQCLPLLGKETLLQTTARRAVQIAEAKPEDLVIVTLAHLQSRVAAQLEECGISTTHILAEPSPRQTAAAIALAADYVSKTFGPDALLWVLPSDHHIGDDAALAGALAQAHEAAFENYLVTFGITPSYPETGYGYIRRGDALRHFNTYGVQRFVEKPDAVTAQTYLDDGHYLWNSGMFLFRADTVLAELSRHASNVLAALDDYALMPSVSFDIAVLEKSDRVAVIPCDPDWSDIGSWASLWAALPHDDDGNALQGTIHVRDTHNSLLHSSHRLMVCAGLEDMIVIDTADALLVAPRSQAESIRHLVHDLKQAHAPETMDCPSETRPWGSFRLLSRAPGYQVREVTIAPGHEQSLHYHLHRAEIWTVIEGEATILLGNMEHNLAVGGTLTAPPELPHRISNRSAQSLRLIEIQRGDNLSEADIFRLSDRYNRPTTQINLLTPLKETA